jgi:hypothetical protein
MTTSPSSAQDPWGNIACTEDETAILTIPKEFQDNFVPENNSFTATTVEGNEHLPDHDDYLSKLETKLGKLQTTSNLTKALEARRSDETRRMLDANSVLDLFDENEADVAEKSAMTRRLFPERQALTLSEIAVLLESDTLAANTETKEEEDKKLDKC